MRFRIQEDSLFAVLLRAPWWVSFLVAAFVLAAARYLLPLQYAVAFALPFAGIGCYAAWKQLRAPSAARLAATLEALRAMPAENFAFVLEEAWRAQGYTVTQRSGTGADYELEKGGRTVLVVCRRWKAKRTGIDPLKELKDAARLRKADAIYLAAGEVTAQARKFASDNAVTLLEGAEIAKLVPRVAQAARRAA